jgi:hypothetical protein
MNDWCKLDRSEVCHCSDFNNILFEPKRGVVSQAKNDPMADALEPWWGVPKKTIPHVASLISFHAVFVARIRALNFLGRFKRVPSIRGHLFEDDATKTVGYEENWSSFLEEDQPVINHAWIFLNLLCLPTTCYFSKESPCGLECSPGRCQNEPVGIMVEGHDLGLQEVFTQVFPQPVDSWT